MHKFLPIILFVMSLAILAGTLISFGGIDPNNFDRPTAQPYFTPAPYTFAIWGVIYIWFIIATFLQWRRHGEDANWNAMRLPLILSLLAGMFWTPSSDGGNIYLATFVIFLMWLGAFWSLIKTPKADPWVGIYPIGLYTGWLCAATGVSLSTLLFDAEISNLWGSILSLAVAAAMAVFCVLRAPAAITVSVAVVWALIGVVVFNLDASQGSTLILTLSLVAAVAVAVLGYSKFKNSAIS